MAKLPKKRKDLPGGWQNKNQLLDLLIIDNDFNTVLNSKLEYPFIDFTNFIFVPNSWQLSKVGFRFFIQIYNYWSLSNQENQILNGRMLINLSDLVNGPWHINGPNIYVWSAIANLELAMFDGDVKRFIDFKKS